MLKNLQTRIETLLFIFVFFIFRTLPVDQASALGGWLARVIGPTLKAHTIACNNLTMVFPGMAEEDKQRLLTRMWDNLGRTAGELPHLPDDRLHRRTKISGTENLPPKGTQAIFFSGHLGNWELTYPIAQRNGLTVTLIYRQANNKQVDDIIARLRATQADDMIPKGPSGAVRLGRAIKNGQSLAMLVDQKMNEGIAVPFFGRDAMTAPAIAELALRYDMPIIPARTVRMGGCHFEGTVYPALVFEKTGDTDKDVLTIMTQINALLESWIREHPDQWFWVHRRWPR